jgi:hypothetical protein
MTGLYKRSGSDNWWIRYSYVGKKYRESSHSPSRKVAEALLKRRLGEIGQGRLVGPAIERTRVGELLNDLQTEYRIQMLADLRKRGNLDRTSLTPLAAVPSGLASS